MNKKYNKTTEQQSERGSRISGGIILRINEKSCEYSSYRKENITILSTKRFLLRGQNIRIRQQLILDNEKR